MQRFLAYSLISMAICGGSAKSDEQRDATKVEFFESKIRPVLVEHCYRCHSGKSGKSKGGLQLDSRSGWQVGGDSGPAIVPHKPEESLIIMAISHSGDISEMPPTSRLPQQIVNDFKLWIASGAVDPRTGNMAARERKDSPGGCAFKAPLNFAQNFVSSLRKCATCCTITGSSQPLKVTGMTFSMCCGMSICRA